MKTNRGKEDIVKPSASIFASTRSRLCESPAAVWNLAVQSGFDLETERIRLQILSWDFYRQRRQEDEGVVG